MASIFNVEIAELGNVYIVKNVILSEAKYILPNSKYIDVPNEVALKLKHELNRGMFITIEKELVDNPKSKDVPIDDFKIEVPNDLEKKKSAIRAKMNQRVSAYTAMITGFDMLEFWLTTAKLNAMGYNVLNESNKEEEFLRIIQTGDEDLISDLERFLEVKDVFDKMMRKHRALKQYFQEINACENEEELEEVVKENKGWLVN